MTTINYGITFFQTRYRDKKLGVMIHFGEKMPYKEGFKSFDRASVLTSVTCTPLPTSEWLSGRLDLGSTISDQNWTERPLVVFVKEHLLLFVVFACCCALYLFQQPQFTGISAVTKTTRHFFLLELRSPRPPWSAFDQRVFQWLRCFRSSLVAQTVKNPSANIGDGRWGGGVDPWVGKTPWRRKRQPTPVFLPENSMDRGAWWATVHGATKGWTQLSN